MSGTKNKFDLLSKQQQLYIVQQMQIFVDQT